MKPVKFFVEGGEKDKRRIIHSTDSAFLRDCGKYWFNQKFDLPDNFKHIGGASEFKEMAPDIRLGQLHHEVILIIDADGDPVTRKKEIEEFQISEGLKFPYFLFPDNANSGEVEHILEQIATDKTKLKCYEDYEKCIGKQLDIKDKIYAYIQAATGNKDAAKDQNRSFINAHFNLDDACLQPLNEFLAPFFS
jgi:hypothetical protein